MAAGEKKKASKRWRDCWQDSAEAAITRAGRRDKFDKACFQAAPRPRTANAASFYAI